MGGLGRGVGGRLSFFFFLGWGGGGGGCEDGEGGRYIYLLLAEWGVCGEGRVGGAVAAARSPGARGEARERWQGWGRARGVLFKSLALLVGQINSDQSQLCFMSCGPRQSHGIESLEFTDANSFLQFFPHGHLLRCYHL